MENKQEAHSAVVNDAVHPPPEVFSPTGRAGGQNGVEDTKDSVIGGMVWAEVRRRAIELGGRQDIISNLTDEQLADFVQNYPDVDFAFYVELGLVEIGDGRRKLCKTGRCLLNAYREVAGK